MRVPIPVISKAKIKPSASRRKLKSMPNWVSQGQLCTRLAPWKTCFAWVSNKIKLVKLTPIAPKAVTPRENLFSHETRVVPSIKGNNIIIGSTLVSNVVNRPKPSVNLIFQGLQEPKESSKILNLESQMKCSMNKTKLCCATCEIKPVSVTFLHKTSMRIDIITRLKQHQSFLYIDLIIGA